MGTTVIVWLVNRQSLLPVFILAEGSTIFLDEIGDIPISQQA